VFVVKKTILQIFICRFDHRAYLPH
jgi:hypothetical protein